MTLPLLLALHLGYGVVMAHAVERRVRAEGAVLGVPLVFAMLPVACVSVPLGAVLLRWAGGWFLHGAFLGEAGIAYERFHLGLMLVTGTMVAFSAAGSFLLSLAFLSREQRRAALAPAWLAGFVTLLTLALAQSRVFVVVGTEGALVFTHPVGLVSAGIFFGLLAAWLYARARLAEPAEERP